MPRTSRWDRPPAPRNLRWFVRGVGRTMVILGLLLLGFVVYQLWGTGIENSREQSRLRAQFEQRLESTTTLTPTAVTEPVTTPADPVAPTTTDSTIADSTIADSTTTDSTIADSTTPDSTIAESTSSTSSTSTTTTTSSTSTTAPPTSTSSMPRRTTPPVAATTLPPTTTRPPTTTTTTSTTSTTTLPPTTTTTTTAPPTTTIPPTTTTTLPVFDVGEVSPGVDLARIEAPAIGLDWIVVSGVGVEDLKKGPGHFPFTPFPGELGNSAIAGHRTTYNGPFDHIVDLVPGDDVIVTTPWGQFVYVVTGHEIVEETDVHVIATTDPTVATLTLTTCHPRSTAEKRWIVYAALDPDRSSTPGAFTWRDEFGVPLPMPEPTTTTSSTTTTTTTSTSTTSTSTTSTSTSTTTAPPTTTSSTTTVPATTSTTTPTSVTTAATTIAPATTPSTSSTTPTSSTSTTSTSSTSTTSTSTTTSTAAPTTTPGTTAPGSTDPASTVPGSRSAETLAPHGTADDTTPPTTGTAATPLTPPTADGPGLALPGGIPAPDDFGDGLALRWFSDSGAWFHVAAWGALGLAICLACWQLAKRYRNLAIGVAIGVLPFTVTLYFFYQNVNRLLPAAF